ncbi:hypothetical protein DL98DRAFT_594520 [Cadophora sp. DSE1049]|nr:hypothetical protein DL98DRAFT_594520 [Cadophora sp. DSE1049]
MSDDMWANAISFILAKVISFAFGEESQSGTAEIGSRIAIWRDLAKDVASWRESRPATFHPFSNAPKMGSPFPSIWLLRPWHIAGEQYCFIAEILLALSEPQAPATTDACKRAAITEHALKVCGLAFTNDDPSGRVNAFGPLTFCGRYLVEQSHQEGLVSMLHEFGLQVGWPVQPIIEDLRWHWSHPNTENWR